MKVFITGGTGSLGTALLRRAESLDWSCTVFSRDEVKQNETRAKFPRHQYVLGDVRDAEWLMVVMKGHDVVIHAGAYKQVPAAEVNAGEAIETNVVGSRNVARAAVRLGIPKVVGVSTDKACAPVNCYGETKALMEKLFQQATLWDDTTFTLVRYGNVLGSRGSVVPLFRKQAETTGTLTLTNPLMTRFWLTLDDAVDLVLAGIECLVPGVIIIPKAPASDMVTLAKAVAPDCKIKITGVRPGEKLHEKLIHSGESVHTNDTGKYFHMYPAYAPVLGNLPEGFEYCSNTAPQLSVEQLRAML